MSKRIQLNGWQRIGVVVSIVWFFVGGFWGNSIGIHQGDSATALLKLCLKYDPDHWDRCNGQFSHDYPIAIQGHWWLALIIAIVPIILGWLLTYAIIRIVKWIRRGFSEPRVP